MNAVNNADPKPLLAPLLAILPNLQTLHAQIPHTDVLLAGVLREAVKCKRKRNPGTLYIIFVRSILIALLGRIANVNLLSIFMSTSYGQSPNCRPFNGCPLLILNRTRGLHGLNMHKILGTFIEAFTVTYLGLVLYAESNRCLAIPDSFTLLSLPKRLTRLSVYSKDPGFESLISLIPTYGTAYDNTKNPSSTWMSNEMIAVERKMIQNLILCEDSRA
jgi:hypothetical protein